MSLTKQQRVMATVLAFGVAAVAFDRLVLGTGSTQPSSANADVGEEPVAKSADPKATPVRMRTVAHQLEAMPGPGEVQDAFFDRSVPVVIDVPVSQANEASANADGSSAGSRPGAEAARSHVLTAILSTPAGPIAVVDGRALQADRASGGMTLRSVEGGSVAIVEIAGQLHRLEIVREPSDGVRRR